MNWFKKLTGGLNKTASNIKGSINSIFKGKKIEAAQLEELEEKLILSDIGLETSESLINDLNKYPLKLSDLCVMTCNPENAPEKVIWASGFILYGGFSCLEQKKKYISDPAKIEKTKKVDK